MRSNHLRYEPICDSPGLFSPSFPVSIHSRGCGGDDGIRTHDPLLAGQVLSQLSYTPIGVFLGLRFWYFFQVGP